jgi:hypothetical protein
MTSYSMWLLLTTWSASGLAFQDPAVGPTDQAPGVVDMGGLKSRPPADWVEEPPDDPTWYKQYRLVPIDEDKAYARVRIYATSKGKEDGAGDWVKRWEAMFFPPQGMTMRQAARVQQLKVHGAPVTLFSIRGDYKGIPGDDASPRQNYRLVAAYFQSPKGPYIIRMFGPAETVAYYRKEFEDWIKSFK